MAEWVLQDSVGCFFVIWDPLWYFLLTARMKFDLQIGLWLGGFQHKNSAWALIDPFSFFHWLNREIVTWSLRAGKSRKQSLIQGFQNLFALRNKQFAILRLSQPFLRICRIVWNLIWRESSPVFCFLFAQHRGWHQAGVSTTDHRESSSWPKENSDYCLWHQVHYLLEDE